MTTENQPPEPAPEVLQATLSLLAPLLGTWRGRGSGHFPTIDSFEYDETTTFAWADDHPLISFEQRTWLRGTGEASHWEIGYIRPIAENVVEIANVQTGGRVEVLRAVVTSSDSDRDHSLTLEAESVTLAQDPRVLRTRRSLRITETRMTYVAWMATNTTSPEDEMLEHLAAELRKEA